jgi:hypothetical protein
MKKVSKEQKRYLFHWLRIVLVVEAIFFIFRDKILFLLLLVSILFFIGLILRISKLYPGRPEPLILDSYAVIISLLIAFAYKAFLISAIFVISIAPVIILPHIIYIIRAEF